MYFVLPPPHPYARLVSECERIVHESSHGSETRWVSWGRLVTLIGEAEAITRTRDEKSIATKPHPTRCPWCHVLCNACLV